MDIVDTGMFPDGKSWWNLECPAGHKQTVVQLKKPIRTCKCERPPKPEQAGLFGVTR